MTIDWITLKIAQNCNINCSYCYVYNLGDESWRDRPRFIVPEIVISLARELRAHCDQHSLKRFTVEFHGGEPLLIGRRKLRELIETLEAARGETVYRYILQTNGLLLTAEWVEFFDEHKISFGISFDGPAEIADQYRVDKAGRGTTARLTSALAKVSKMEAFERRFGGALMVLITPEFDACELLKWFSEQGIRRLDFLLPDGNYVSPPANPAKLAATLKFLIAAFDHWLLDSTSPHIRLFEYIIRGLTGERVALDYLGGDPSTICVVETNGEIGVSDVARFCKPLELSKMNVATHKLDQFSETYDLTGLAGLSQKCLSCEFLTTCGGGYLPHRYDGQSFNNQSFYCSVLYGLSDHIAGRVNGMIESAVARRHANA